ncbi:hypothetical protein K458DRAFT_423539 [Lentithecium fluviatile CBS 122367]|uniref:GPI anchored protein n=1 Tax=Lentithecium fluviatile CBS 122367 TaxID=1168545 RepID=A0A6G1IIL6_9PLEO|nr:hypothetical protein K458DRAFT_423539 [Lentithecium fluviatile CBS 122367]
MAPPHIPIVLTTLLHLSLTLAQTTTLTLPFFGYDGDQFAASVVTAQPSATVLALGCPGSTECGLFPYQTLTYGPSTYHMDMSVDGDGFTMTQDCVFEATQAVCEESASGSEANFPGSSTETYEASGSAAGLVIVVTKGAEKLGSVSATTTGSASGVTTSASAGSGVSQTAASATKTTGSSSASTASTMKTVGSSSASAASASSSPTNAAGANGVALRRGVVGVAAGLLGGLLL